MFLRQTGGSDNWKEFVGSSTFSTAPVLVMMIPLLGKILLKNLNLDVVDIHYLNLNHTMDFLSLSVLLKD